MTETTSRLPAGACDCHTHVFLDPTAFPFAAARRYTPPPASIEALVDWQERLGIARTVIVQASVHGNDHATLRHALQVLGPRRARGVASLGPATTDAELADLAAVGVRGVRVNLEIDGESDGGRAREDLRRAAARVAPLGWHVQTYASLDLLARCADVLADLPVPVVLDHFAGWRVDAAQPDAPPPEALAPVLDLLAAGRVAVKLSAGYRVGASPAALGAVARRLIAANPARVVWGSDWPHPDPSPAAAVGGIHTPFGVDLPDALRQLRDWCDGDADLLRRLLVDNPAALYDF